MDGKLDGSSVSPFLRICIVQAFFHFEGIDQININGLVATLPSDANFIHFGVIISFCGKVLLKRLFSEYCLVY